MMTMTRRGRQKGFNRGGSPTEDKPADGFLTIFAMSNKNIQTCELQACIPFIYNVRPYVCMYVCMYVCGNVCTCT